MSDRLKDFQHQRDLLREHLAWLDREIAAEQAKPLPGTVAAPRTPPATAPRPEASVDLAALARQYRADPADAVANSKRGCWIVFAGTFLVLGLSVIAWYLLRRG